MTNKAVSAALQLAVELNSVCCGYAGPTRNKQFQKLTSPLTRMRSAFTSTTDMMMKYAHRRLWNVAPNLGDMSHGLGNRRFQLGYWDRPDFTE
jgi:hypothetical protein